MLKTACKRVVPDRLILGYRFVNRNQVFNSCQQQWNIFLIQYFFEECLINFVEIHGEIFFFIRFARANAMIVCTTTAATATRPEKLLVVFFLKMYYVIYTVWQFTYGNVSYVKGV